MTDEMGLQIDRRLIRDENDQDIYNLRRCGNGRKQEWHFRTRLLDPWRRDMYPDSRWWVDSVSKGVNEGAIILMEDGEDWC